MTDVSTVVPDVQAPRTPSRPRTDRIAARQRQRLTLPTLVVVAVSMLLYGSPPPRLSEELYLPLVQHAADPSFLANDWTFGGEFREHWVFNHLFAPIGDVLSLTTLGWAGRLACWSILAWQLVRLGTRAGLGRWWSTTAIVAWLVFNQTISGGEWVIGTFEAKAVAYITLFGALLAATRRRVPLAVALLGTTVSLHPAVGLWGGLGIGGALLVLPETRRSALRWSWLGVLLALPGVWEIAGATGRASAATLRFVVIEATPYHLDPLFPGSSFGWMQYLRLATLVGMFAANVWWFRRSDRDITQRLLLWSQVLTAIPFALGLVARLAHAWQLLIIHPFRAFPLLVPLVFFLHALGAAQSLAREERQGRRARPPRWRRRSTLVVAATFLLALTLSVPKLAAPRLLVANARAWTENDPTADAFRWVDANLAEDVTCIFPITRQDSFALARRAQVVNFQAIRYDELEEWMRRVMAVVGGPEAFDEPGWQGEHADLAAEYRALRPAQVQAVADGYDATCIVTEADYPFEVLSRHDDVTVYRLQPT